jgi:CheY-like chemotaxis protein
MIQRGFKKGKIGNKVNRVTNGQEGLEFLKANEPSDIKVILLDLNMEVMNGFEFLQKRLELPEIRKIPVVILSSSHREQDIEKAYKLEANSYVEKPLDPTEFINAILSIQDFWIFFAKRP